VSSLFVDHFESPVVDCRRVETEFFEKFFILAFTLFGVFLAIRGVITQLEQIPGYVV
jgi:hypothetical protein